MLASLACTFLTSLLSGLMSVVSLLGTAAGFLIGLLFSLFTIQAIFNTALKKALLMSIFNGIAQIAAMLPVTGLTGVSLAALFGL